jgi:hypothetical protein
MRNTPVIRIMVIFLCCMGLAQATPKYFYSDGTIQDGDSWYGVRIYDTPPNHTTVNMTGGVIVDNGISVYDAATFNFSGGVPGWISAYNQSIANITGGFSATNVTNNATVNISSNASVAMAEAYGFGIFNVYSGNIGQLIANENSIVNLMGGTITTFIGAELSATINVFGSDLAKTNTGGLYGDGQVTGFWQDGSPFTINFLGSGAYSVTNLIPEPATFLLLGVGTFLLRKSKRRIQKSL